MFYPPAAPETAFAQYAFGLYPIDQETLLGEAIADLGLGIAVLHLLCQVAPLVGDFDKKLSHFS